MTHPMEPVLFEQDDPAKRGQAHGEMWRAEIEELTAIRSELTLRRGAFTSMPDVLAVAELHLPILERVAPAMYAELRGIAAGSNRSPADIVVLNQYTDLRDVPPSVLGAPAGKAEDAEPDGCTAIYLNGVDGPLLGQTWDMHATAEPFVRMIRVRPRGADHESLAFTLTGCLGMAGIGSDAVAVTINNLSSTDGRIGLVWPALVRTLLELPSAEDAHAQLLRTPLSSGHHYMLADGRSFHGVECSGELKVRTQRGPRASHLHTNHCFDPVLRGREQVSKLSTTFARLNMATTLYAQQRPASMDELWALLGSHDAGPSSLCTHQDEVRQDPDASRTCGRLVMELATGRVRVSRGCSRTSEALDLQLTRFRPADALAPGSLHRPATLPARE